MLAAILVRCWWWVRQSLSLLFQRMERKELSSTIHLISSGCPAEMNRTPGTTGHHKGKAGMPAAMETPAWSQVTPTSSLPGAGNKTGAARPGL